MYRTIQLNPNHDGRKLIKYSGKDWVYIIYNQLCLMFKLFMVIENLYAPVYTTNVTELLPPSFQLSSLKFINILSTEKLKKICKF